MEYLIKDLIENLVQRRKHEMENIEKYIKNDIKELILITSGKIMELDFVIQNLKEMLIYQTHTKTLQQ